MLINLSILQLSSSQIPSLPFLHLQSLPLTPPPPSFSSSSRRRIRPLSSAAAKTPLPEMDASVSSISPQISTGSHLLKIAIIGFGNYGQFLAKTLISQGHTVLAYSRTDHSVEAQSLGVSFFLDPHDLCEQQPQVILLCTSIMSTEEALKSLPLYRFKRNTLFVDVLSVKEFAKKLLLDTLPSDFDIVCCHPMFGPQSAKQGWEGLNFVYEKVRVGEDELKIDRCKSFLEIFGREGCRMVELSCEEHDKYAAGTQFITHTVGRLLQMLRLESTPINTKGYGSLLDLVENTSGDSFDLYYGLFMFNKNALQMLERLNLGFQALKEQLLGSVHEAVRKELFGNGERGYVDGHQNGVAIPCSSKDGRYQDASQLYQYKEPTSDSIGDISKLKIGIVGFGNFGQFLAKTFVQQGHKVLAYSRSDYSNAAQKLGVSYFSDANDLCEEHPEVILFCTSILSTDNVLKSFPVHRLKRSTLIVDVLSVKEFPKNLFLQHLPPDFDILCTHPMFGPESGKNGWNSLPFVFDKVRVGADDTRVSRCNRFLDIFASEGCRMVEMTCAEHDRHAAGSQFVTHTVGRMLEKLGLESTPINTRGYETLLNLVENTTGDSFDLYYGLFMYNVNAMEQLERIESAFEALKKQLFGRLHGVLRKHLFDNAESQVSVEELELLKSPVESSFET